MSSDDLADLAVTRTDGSGTVIGIRLDRLASLTTGILATAFGSGVAGIVESLWATFVIWPLEGASSWIDVLSDTLVDGMDAISSAAWAPLTEFVVSFGPVAWIAAVLAIIVIAYGVNRGWSLRG